MITAGPGETITITQSGLPTGRVVGYQVIKAASGTIAIGRTTASVVERPAGSGNYVATFSAPVEVDVYLVVIDWNAGVITPSTSKVEEMQVTSTINQEETGLGPVADYTKTALGGETWRLLMDSEHYGPGYIALAIETIKARVMMTSLPSSLESTLPIVVLSYLGKLTALQLMTAAADVWSFEAQSRSVGNDPVEITTYASREAMLRLKSDWLLAQASKEMPLALQLLPDARLPSNSAGPAIDEDAGQRVTPDPRTFPRQPYYPFSGPASPVVAASGPSRSDRYGT
jgi:hypothetical protein